MTRRQRRRRYLATAQDANASSEDVAAAIAAMHAEGMLESPQDFTFALKSLGRKRLCRLAF